MEKIIKSFLEEYNLLNPDKTYLVAFSGGYDSMCLLDILKKIAKNKIVAIHLNHNWRGNESDLEEENCKDFCFSIGVEFYSEKLNKDCPHTETYAREARYKFFETCAKKFHTDVIFTAHNKNDNAETLVYRITKGTGVAGLQGIAQNRDIYYRPLLNIDRKTIEKYCSDNNLAPNNDSSNKNTKYKRNFIRCEVFPQLEKINNDVVDKIHSLSQVAREETQIVEEYIDYILNKISKDNKIKTKEFIKLSKPVQNRIIYNIFIKNNLDYDREKILNIIEFIKENLNSKSGKTCSLTTDLWIFVSEKYIEIINKNNGKFDEISIKNTGNFETDNYIFSIKKFNEKFDKFPKDSENIAYVNLEKVEFPFTLRTRQNGDIIRPLGSSGTQKLKKYLNNKKIPNHEKDNLLLLAKDNEIFWCAGFGISDKIKIEDRITHKLTLKRKEDKQ